MDARRRSALTALLVTGAALVGAAPAGAAYAPTFSLKVDPATANSASSITSTITQAPGETASKTVTVTLPPGFSPNPTNTLVACSAVPCAPESQMGSATATALGMTISGPVYFGGTAGAAAFRLLLSLPAVGTLPGTAALQPDGSVTTVFDNLPPVLVTALTLVLDGGNKALLRTPSKCGDYTSNASFVSQTGETSSGSSPMTISGCSAGTSPGAGTSPTGTGPAGTSPSGSTSPVKVGAPKLSRLGTVTFTLSAPAKVTVTVTRAGKRIGRKTVSGRRGTNRVRLGKRVRRGSYRVSVTAVDASGRRAVRTVNARIR